MSKKRDVVNINIDVLVENVNINISDEGKHQNDSTSWIRDALIKAVKECDLGLTNDTDIITEKWLLDVGFKKHNDDLFSIRSGTKGLMIFIKSGDVSIDDNTSMHSDWYSHICSNVKTQRQIKNIYYRLTDKELITKQS